MSTLEGARTALIDLSRPRCPEADRRGRLHVTDATGEERDYYFANVGGQYALFARKEGAGGPILYDLTDPEGAQFVGTIRPSGATWGYVSLQGDDVFVGTPLGRCPRLLGPERGHGDRTRQHPRRP